VSARDLDRRSGELPGHPHPAQLADVLERVLDKGIVIAGDIQINLLDIELLTVKLRLLIASADKAREMGIDWWEHDPTLSPGQRDLADENRRLRERIGALEAAGDGDSNDGDNGNDRDRRLLGGRVERREEKRGKA